jgi:hypothetical protein
MMGQSIHVHCNEPRKFLAVLMPRAGRRGALLWRTLVAGQSRPALLHL